MIRINLLDRVVTGPLVPSPMANTRRIEATAALCLLCTLALVFGANRWVGARATEVEYELGSANARLAALEPELQRVSALQDRLTQLVTGGAAVEAQRGRHIAPAPVLAALGDTLPPDLWVVALDFDEQGVTVEGQGGTVESVTAFVEALNATGRVLWPLTIAETTRQPGPDGVIASFTLRGGSR